MLKHYMTTRFLFNTWSVIHLKYELISVYIVVRVFSVDLNLEIRVCGIFHGHMNESKGVSVSM